MKRSTTTRCTSRTSGSTLSYRQLRAILVEVARRGRVIGFDVVELNPSRDPAGVTARVVTWIIAHFLSEIFEQPR